MRFIVYDGVVNNRIGCGGRGRSAQMAPTVGQHSLVRQFRRPGVCCSDVDVVRITLAEGTEASVIRLRVMLWSLYASICAVEPGDATGAIVIVGGGRGDMRARRWWKLWL